MLKKLIGSRAAGHGVALFTIIVWGTTMISSKLLLAALTPAELIFGRFAIALAALNLLELKRMPPLGLKRELALAAAGLCGVTLYFMCESAALTLTYASNVSVIITTSPFFTALITAAAYRRRESLSVRFFAGFAAAVAGVSLISFASADGSAGINPAGDLLAVAAACAWGGYSVLTSRIADFGYSTVQTTRRIFMYGLLFMLPVLPFSGFSPTDFTALASPTLLLNLLYLALCASALCFLTWNFAIVRLGPVGASVYIYAVPVVTVTFSAVALGEPVTWVTLAGMGLTVAGLTLSSYRGRGV